MLIQNDYLSPMGRLIILADDQSIKGIWFHDQKYLGAGYDLQVIPIGENKITIEVKDWLKRYFAGENPTVNLAILAPEVTDFRRKVLELLVQIPYGQTTTYKAIAEQIAKLEGKEKSSARAVGGAVGHNPISLLIPCHRVLGSKGELTGYAGGIERKIALLNLEGGQTI
ncbi:TPA: methylated-DNA--[protein]-cysteine S-methyltransferase [Streptococcus suis]|uniref:Methylated-DNA--protein-cysteine methyltransferase n=2 Tax=Streptococcus suis TaxID=1307 RepID=A0A0Z8I9Y3_STRSU|nr:methylated-DNA--[protein]-cysteine S-methyltransferase [Streptococcus suis]MCQ8272178.1 methylated-DNA--[protein]-cysteine S-methyltransferase [Streptococcus suis]MCQ8786077.1 methylated-DNA--[protein]-cysteine S-methyltransferase [Streptococcus suis]MDW8721054.1 methylated-DNA--[protein]-cysteine S-methyltransferase [Streptococcus suis]MDY7595020.1 methylated-DNA--[protein]-cysteine S-methyltransferase [Streptococcus suis]MDY7595970.1 methylated-DNA--[protein]-cysteine S-methyltransferase 